MLIFFSVVCIGIAFIVGLFSLMWLILGDEFKAIALGALCCSIVVIYMLATNETIAQAERDRDARMAAEAYERGKPRLLYREGDCEIYQFEAGYHMHYFTKCPNSTVTTDSTVQDGKRSRQDQIVTH